ncbi:MAG: MFS transporter, partial [Acidimicrobiia bacterium]|nr:MFS transporter [Acidimicrobiia bacterium]
MERRTTIAAIESPALVAAALESSLRLEKNPSGSFSGPLSGDVHARLEVFVTENADGSTIDLCATQPIEIPFFGWAFDPVHRWVLRRGLRYSAQCIRAALSGQAAPSELKRSPLSAPAEFSEHQINFLATTSLAAGIAAFGAALFGQNASSIADSFGVEDAGLGTALAITRLGVLFALIAAIASDRIGRRKVILWSVAVVCIANAVSGLAPNFEIFTGSQLFLRAAVNSALVIGGIAVIEEAPDGARAWAVSILS